MALTNSQRQARYRQRLKDAAQGVTPEMVVRAARILFEGLAKDDPSIGSWEDHVARCNRRKNVPDWREFIPDDPCPDIYDFLDGEDREIVVRVAAVINAATKPPRQTQASPAPL